MEAHESARIAQNMQLLHDEVKEFRARVSKELRDMHDIDKMACDQILSIRNDIICLIRRIEKLEDDKGESVKPLEPAKIDLSKMAPGQHAKNRSGNLVYFLVSHNLQHPPRYVFVNDIGGYFDCDVDGKHATDRDYDIVEIIPLEGE